MRNKNSGGGYIVINYLKCKWGKEREIKIERRKKMK